MIEDIDKSIDEARKDLEDIRKFRKETNDITAEEDKYITASNRLIWLKIRACRAKNKLTAYDFAECFCPYCKDEIYE